MGLIEIRVGSFDVDLEYALARRRIGMTREGVLRRWTRHPNLSETPRDCLCCAIGRDFGDSSKHRSA